MIDFNRNLRMPAPTIALIFLLGVAGLCTSAVAGVVTVTANQSVSQSYSNDMGVMQSLFGDATRTGDTYMYYPNITASSSKLRIFSFGSDWSNNAFVPDGNLYWGLLDAKGAGVIPHVVCGYYRPPSLPADAWTWSPSTWSEYSAYAQAFVNYVVNTGPYPCNSAYFEIGNEWDISAVGDTAPVWLLGPSGNTSDGSKDRYNAYLQLYTVWANAIQAVQNANPTKSLYCCGPACTNGSVMTPNVWGTSGPCWTYQLPADCKTNNLKFDWLTFHYYGNMGAVGNGPAESGWPSLLLQLQYIRAGLNSAGWATYPTWRGFWMTEWGPTTYNDANRGRINVDMRGSAWAAAFAATAPGGFLSMGTFLSWDDGGGEYDNGLMTLMGSSQTPYPKPIYNVGAMFRLMPGTRVQVTTPSGQPDLGAIASSSSTAASVLVYNYNYNFSTYTDQTVNEAVSVQFNDLPFTGSVVVRQYLIDYNHSDVAYFYDTSTTPGSGACNLQLVNQYNATVSSGALSIAQITLSTSGTTLWTVSPN